MHRRDVIKSALVLPLLSSAPFQTPPASAQAKWPARNVTIIVPFPPGGQADIAARAVGAVLEKSFGQPIVVDNRAGGAGGSVGNAAAARAAPDGYTLVMALASFAVLPEADRVLGRQPAYEVAQFEPVARIIADPVFLTVSASAPWKTAQDFIEDARKRPGAIAYGSSGPYGTVHVAMEMLSYAAGIKLLHVPFRGGGPALAALLSDTVAVIAASPGVFKAQVEAGKLRLLASWGGERTQGFPDIPTFRELGYPEVEFYGWAGLFAPRGVPAAIMTQLREATRLAVLSPETRAVFEAGGTLPAYLDAPEFARFVEADTERLVAVVRKMGAAQN